MKKKADVGLYDLILLTSDAKKKLIIKYKELYTLLNQQKSMISHILSHIKFEISIFLNF